MSFSQLKLAAFTSGIVVPIESVPDPVFAGRMLGDGLAIDPSEGVLYAPCDGVITQLHASRHACILESASFGNGSGARMLLHIGIDTVLLKGEGFVARVAQGDSVSAGQALIEFDMAALKRHGKPAITMLVVENGDEFRIDWRTGSRSVWTGDALMTVVAANAPAAVDAGAPSGDTEIENANGWATVRHAGGLHARPCALLANAVKKYEAAVEIRAHGKSANARSATAIMGLAIGEGEEVEISASGANAGDALEAAIIALETPSEAEHAAPVVVPVAAAAGSLLSGQLAGVVASPGLVIGVTVRFDHVIGAINEQGEGETLERRALSAALHAVVGDIEAAISEAERRGFVEQADIFSAHRVLAEDPEMFAYASGLIAAGKSAAFAWRAAAEAQCETLVATGNALLAGRAADLRDIERQVLRKLAGDAVAEPELPPNAVVLADDLVPSDFAALLRAKVAAIVTAKGGATSHIAILARAQGIPTLVALGLPLAEVRDGLSVIVDADRGLLDVAPTAERIAAAKVAIERQSTVRAQVMAQAHEKAETTDGVRIEVAANIATAADAAEAVKLGAESVGLLRTELLFLDRETAPTEAEQRAAYQAVIDGMESRSVIIRTLDVGADKSLPYIAMPEEENPALGLRGIRLCLAREALLVEQLRAILAVKPLSAVKIMLPMVTDAAEISATRIVLDRLTKEMGITERVELGVMIETPSAAILADQLAQEADFFSVGTNDLTQYALCMDRTNPALAARVDGLHPAVLRLLAQAAHGVARNGKWLGVCGAMASDPIAVPLLIGLGVTELSVSPAVIPEIKAVVRRVSLAECRSVAQAALQLTSADAIRAHVKAAWPWLDASRG